MMTEKTTLLKELQEPFDIHKEPSDVEIIMDGVREYNEEMPVLIKRMTDKEWPGYGRLVVRAENDFGHNSTEVDLLDLIGWLRKNWPEVFWEGGQ